MNPLLLRRQPQKAQHQYNEGQRVFGNTLVAKETTSFLRAGTGTKRKTTRRRLQGITVFNLVKLLRIIIIRRWRLLSLYSRAVLPIVIALFTVQVIFATIDCFFHTYGPPSQPLVSYSGNNETTTTVSTRSSSSSSTGFAIVINTYKRPDMLKAAVQHYANTCGRARIGVEQVFVVWAELDVTPPDSAALLLASSSSSLPSRLGTADLQKTTVFESSSSSRIMDQAAAVHVEIIRVAVDSLNSRFLPIANLSSTAAIFMVDDDVIVDCFSLHQGFLAWKSSPDSMVGYYPRLAAASSSAMTIRSTSGGHDDDAATTTTTYVYHSWPVVYWRHEMNFVLTKAAFLHSRYLDLYSTNNNEDDDDDDDDARHPHPAAAQQREIREYVDVHRNCEDVAMAMLIAHVTAMESIVDTKNKNKMPAMPIYVQGHVSDKGLFHGISTGTGHFPQRSACLNDLTRIYRRHYDGAPTAAATTSPPPLLFYRVPLRQASWVHPAPGFWWQYRPSNIFEWFAIQDIFQ
jgi:Glycosyl transferase family 64 domain